MDLLAYDNRLCIKFLEQKSALSKKTLLDCKGNFIWYVHQTLRREFVKHLISWTSLYLQHRQYDFSIYTV